jgi:uncharacterized membrane protein YcaP (DUF421 family)
VAGVASKQFDTVSVNWHEIFAVTVPPLELIVRGTAIYWLLFLLFRFLLRRDVGALGVADVLLLVLLADAAQNAMAGEYRSITDGAVLVSTIVAWNMALDRLAFHSAAARRILEPPQLLLVRNGRILHRNLRREFLTVDELEAQLRENGIEDISEVRAAYLESDGAVSVIPHGRGTHGSPRRRPKTGPGP